MVSGCGPCCSITQPFGTTLYDRVTPLLSVGDQEVFASEGMREMFIGDLQHGSRRQFKAALHDATLFGRDWGFLIADVRCRCAGGTATSTRSCRWPRPSRPTRS